MVILFEFKPPVITPQKHDPAQLKSTIMGQKCRKAHLRCVSAGPMQACQAGLMLHEYYPDKPAPRRRRKGMEDTVIAYEPTSQRRRSSFGQSLAKLMPKKITTHGDPRAGHDDLLRLEGQIFQTLRVSPKVKVKFSLSEILSRIFKELFLCTRFSTQLSHLLEQPKTFFVLEGSAPGTGDQDLVAQRDELRTCIRELDWNNFRPIGDITGSAASSGAWLMMKKLVDRGWSWQVEDEDGKSSLVLRMNTKSASPKN